MSWMPCPDAERGDRASADAVKAVIVPRAVDVGEMEVRRALPAKQAQMVGPFIFFDQMGPAEFSPGRGLDVRPHPHINLATVTYLLDGEILHRDSLGNRQPITPGAVNWMRAGSGIVHSERSPEEDRDTERSLLGLQTWVALPERLEESEPEFIHHDADELPVVEADGGRLRIVAGTAFGESSPLQTASDTLYVDVALRRGARLSIAADYVERALYPIEGEIEVGGESFSAGELLILHPGEPVVLCGETDARVALFGGEPMEGPRYIWWNFVSSREDRIKQAMEDWSEGRFGTVPGDEEEFIPLPEKRNRPRRVGV